MSVPGLSLEEFLALAQEFLSGRYAEVFERAVFIGRGGHRVVHTLPPPRLAAARPAPTNAQAFVPSPFQEAILGALEGVALRTDALGAAVGDKSRLYRAGGLQELREHGLVAHHPRLGFYRPDCPPEQLADGSERS